MNDKKESNNLDKIETIIPLIEISSNNNFEFEHTASKQFYKNHLPIQTPRSELDETLPLTHSVSSTIFDFSSKISFQTTPLLNSLKLGDEYCHYFNLKCNECCKICDFSKKDFKELCQQKEKLLNEILFSVSDPNIILTFGETEYLSIYKCFKKNIIRSTPNAPLIWFAPVCIDFTLDRVEEIGWSHLSLIYDILYSFIINPNFNPLIKDSVALKIIKLSIPMFESPDIREREKLTSLYHAFYRSFKQFRNEARFFECTYLLKAQEDSNYALGCSNLLTTSVSIISGFKIPLLKEHINYFKKVLLPLHHSSLIHLFHSSLLNCIIAFINKNNSFVQLTLENLFIKWPISNPTKELLFLREIEVLSQYINSNCSIKIIKNLCYCLKKCILNVNFAISERTLLLWENDKFNLFFQKYSYITYPIILPTLYKTIQSHWSLDVKSLSLLTMKVLKSFNLNEFESVGKNLKKIETDRVIIEMEKGITWGNLASKYCQSKILLENIRVNISKLFIGCESIKL